MPLSTSWSLTHLDRYSLPIHLWHSDDWYTLHSGCFRSNQACKCCWSWLIPLCSSVFVGFASNPDSPNPIHNASASWTYCSNVWSLLLRNCCLSLSSRLLSSASLCIATHDPLPISGPLTGVTADVSSLLMTVTPPPLTITWVRTHSGPS